MGDEYRWRIDVAPHFLNRLAFIESFLDEVDASAAYDALLDALDSKVIPNLRRFPRMGRRRLDDPPLSIEALTQLGNLPLRASNELREYLHGDFLVLYLPDDETRTVHLLSIRHRREFSFHGGLT